MPLGHKGQRGDGDSLLNERFGLLGLGLSIDRSGGAFPNMHGAGLMGEIHTDIIGIGFNFLLYLGQITLGLSHRWAQGLVFRWALGRDFRGHERFLNRAIAAFRTGQHPRFCQFFIGI